MDKTLVASALRYRNTSLFKTLDDSQIFAVRLDDGETGYCCVMGNAGAHYSLALYRGKTGFRTYLDTIHHVPLMSEMDLFEYQMSLHAINCDFDNADDCLMSKKQRDEIREIAAEEGLKICRPKGWPDFVVYDGCHHTTSLSERQRRDMTEALDAACEIARVIGSMDYAQIIGMGLDPVYTPDEGGKRIPLLTRGADGTWQISDTLTPAYEDTKSEESTPEYDNEEAIGKIRRIRHRGVMECRVAHIPCNVGTNEDNYNPVTIIAANLPSGEMPFMPPLLSEMDDDDIDFAILDNFAENLISAGCCPMTIQTDDHRTFLCLEDFCDKTGIRLHMVSRLEFVPQIWMMFRMI